MEVSSGQPGLSKRHAKILLILSLVSLLNYYDRNLISMLIEDLKRDLRLSDAQIGALTGLAFTLIYTVVAVPIARFADSGRRVLVLSGSLALWSAMTAACGLAGNFTGLVLARLGVGVGEAGGAPTTHALVADTFGPKWRGTALSILGVTGGLGSILALLIGGGLASRYGWRGALMLSSIPGLLLAILLCLSVREPTSLPSPRRRPSIGIIETFRILRGRPSFLWLAAGIAVMTVGAYGQQVWTPAFVMRRYHMDAASAGAALSLVSLPGVMIGTFAGGVLSDWLGRYDPRWPAWLLILSFATTAPLQSAFFLLDDYRLALAIEVPAIFLSVLWVAPVYALIQALSGPRLRATAASLLFLIVNFGLGFGPLLVGLVSDRLTSAYGDAALGHALFISCSMPLLGGVLIWRVARTLAQDIADASAAG